MVEQAIVLAGGFGTRLKKIVPDLPKPMAPVGGKPFLEYILSHLSKEAIKKIVLAVGYKHLAISNYFGDRFGDIELVYSVETGPLGTGGAIRAAKEFLANGNFLVINGDTFLTFRKEELVAELDSKSECVGVLALVESGLSGRYGIVELGDKNLIKHFGGTRRHRASKQVKCYINAGVGLFRNKMFDCLDSHRDFFSLEKDLFPALTGSNRLCGHVVRGYFIDIGIPEDYQRAQKDLPGLDIFHE